METTITETARAYAPAEGVTAIPAEEHTPRPRLMGRAADLLAPGEGLLPRYYALREVRTGGLLCVPSRECGASVIALYGTPADAVMARKDWFRRAFSEVLCVEMFSDVAQVRFLSAAEALQVRRSEAAARGEDPSLIALPATAPAASPADSGDTLLRSLIWLGPLGWAGVAGSAVLLFLGVRALMLLAGAH